MQYDEVKPIIDPDKLLLLSAKTGRSVSEICKQLIKDKRHAEMWTRAHIERGHITKIDVEQAREVFFLNVSFALHKPDRNGSTIRTVRSALIDESKIHMYDEYLDCDVLLFVSYTPNPTDGSVFRVLLDIEKDG